MASRRRRRLGLAGVAACVAARVPPPPEEAQRHYSIVLPLHPKQFGVYLSATASWGELFKWDKFLDTFLVSTPCLYEEPTRAIARGERYEGAQSPLRPATAEHLESHRGRLETLEAGDGFRERVLGFIPSYKFAHYCDDWVICGDVRCKFGYREKYRRPAGWFVQQLVKLGASRLVNSPHYLVIDAEVYATARISVDALVDANGVARALSRCCLGAACARSGRTLSSLVGRWERSYNHSLFVLGRDDSIFDLPVPPDACVLGVTPQILRTRVVRDILSHIEERQRSGPEISTFEPSSLRTWWKLLSMSRFTEFSLYNTYLLLFWDEFGRALHNYSYPDASASLKGSLFADLRDSGAPHEDVLTRARAHVAAALDNAPISFLVCHDETTLTPAECADFARQVRDAPPLLRGGAEEYLAATATLRRG